MKYRVKKSMVKQTHNGDTFSVSSYRDDIYVNDRSGIELSKEEIERNPDWFEKVEQVQEGDYFKNRHGIFRIIRDGIDENKDWYGEQILSERACQYIYMDEDELLTGYTKLSTDEIEQALIKEAKRRGYAKGAVFNRDWDFINELGYNAGKREHAKVNKNEFKYDPERDVLFVGVAPDTYAIYWEGNWASVVDQTPHIEINGYEADFHEDYVQFGCAKIDKQLFKETINAVYDNRLMETFGEGNKAIEGIKIGKGVFTLSEIEEIAEYYENV